MFGPQIAFIFPNRLLRCRPRCGRWAAWRRAPPACSRCGCGPRARRRCCVAARTTRTCRCVVSGPHHAYCAAFELPVQRHWVVCVGTSFTAVCAAGVRASRGSERQVTDCSWVCHPRTLSTPTARRAARPAPRLHQQSRRRAVIISVVLALCFSFSFFGCNEDAQLAVKPCRCSGTSFY